MRWNADAGDLRNGRRVEALQRLSCESLRCQETGANVEAPFPKGACEGCTQLFDRDSDTLPIRVRITPGAERVGADIFEFAFCLEAEGQLLRDGERVEDGPRSLCGRLPGVQVARVRLGEGDEERAAAEVLARSSGEESHTPRPLVLLQSSIRIDLCQLFSGGHVAQRQLEIGLAELLASN